MQNNENHTTYIATQESSHLGLIDRVTNLAIENRDAGLVIAGAIGTSIVIVAISHSAARLIEAVRK